MIYRLHAIFDRYRVSDESLLADIKATGFPGVIKTYSSGAYTTVEFQWSDEDEDRFDEFDGLMQKVVVLLRKWEEEHQKNDTTFEALLGKNDSYRDEFCIHGFAHWKIIDRTKPQF